MIVVVSRWFGRSAGVRGEALATQIDASVSLAALAGLARAGDERAMTLLVAAFRPFVRSRSAAYAVRGLERDDLEQEGMLGLLAAVRSFRVAAGVPFQAYACLCIRRRMVSALRRARGGGQALLNSAFSLDDQTNASFVVSSKDANPEEVVIFKEMVREACSSALRTLSLRERMILSLYLSGVSYVGMAGRLHVGVKSIDNTLQKIRRQFRLSGLAANQLRSNAPVAQRKSVGFFKGVGSNPSSGNIL